MKKIGEYSTKGTIASGVETKILLFDGRFDTGYRLTKFMIFGRDFSSINDSMAIGRVATVDGLSTGTATFWTAGDNRELAWSSTNGYDWGDMIIDSDNLIVEDVYVTILNVGGVSTNFLMEFEKYDITDWRGALAMVRNRSQS